MQKIPEEILELLKCNLPVRRLSYMFIFLLIFILMQADLLRRTGEPKVARFEIMCLIPRTTIR